MAVNGQEIRSIGDLKKSIQKRGAGEALRLRVQRRLIQSFETIVTRPQAPS